jgi:hypothetical protein
MEASIALPAALIRRRQASLQEFQAHRVFADPGINRLKMEAVSDALSVSSSLLLASSLAQLAPSCCQTL